MSQPAAAPAAAAPSPEGDDLAGLYQALLLPRLIEEKMLKLLRQGKLGKWFSGIGQEAIAVGVVAALEDEDPDVFLAAVGNVAKARGMSAIAERAGLGRESLYKALTPGAKPRYDTVLKVLQSLGVKLSVSAA